MAEKLTEDAQEEGTYVIDFAWLDENGAAVTPSTMTWTLVDENGDVVNSRQDVAISGLSTTNSIVLSGLDLAIPDTDMSYRLKRYVRYAGTYVSTLGTLPLTGEVWFNLINHRAKA
jgi:hypothetical protein